VVEQAVGCTGPGWSPSRSGDDSLVVVAQAGGVLAERAALTFREVAEPPLVGGPW